MPKVTFEAAEIAPGVYDGLLPEQSASEVRVIANPRSWGDNRNGRDLWDAAIDYVDSQGECGRPEIPYTIKHNSEIK